MSTIKEFRNFDQISWGIRVTTDKNFGSGHLSRCLLLSKHLGDNITFFTDPFDSIKHYTFIKEKNFASINYSLEALKAKKISCLIVDNYNIKKHIIEKICQIGPVITFDDFNRNWNKPIVIGSSLSQSLFLKESKIIEGPKYAIVDKKFYKNKNIFKKKLLKNNLRKIMIHVGTNDSKNTIYKILKCLWPFSNLIDKITVVLSRSAPNYDLIASSLKEFTDYKLTSFKSVDSFIKEYFKNNYFIGAAGVSCLERISLSAYSLIFSINKNQELNASAIKKLKLGYYGGNIHKISLNKLKKIIAQYILNEKYAKKIISNTIIDGKGPERVVKRIKYLLKNVQ